MGDPVEQVVTAPDGRRLAVLERGVPDGLPLFALRGTPGSRPAHWRDANVYARYGLRRITCDRAGYGGSTRRAGRLVDDVVHREFAWLSGRGAAA